MDQKYGEFVGVDQLTFAKVLEDSIANYLTEAPKYLAPVAEIAGEPEINNKTTYYDNKAANTYVTEGKTEIKIIVSGIPGSLAAELLGKVYDIASGRVLDTGKANPPDIAIGFKYDRGNEGNRYYWYHKGKFSGGAEEASTKTNDVDEKTYTLTYTAVTTTYEWMIDGKSQSLKRVFGDTTDANFDGTGWFNQVQTPDAVGAPQAIAFISSNPVDADVGIAVSVSPTITINNAISEYSVSLIDAATFAPVATSMSLDETKKILTVNPTAPLAAATEYILIASSIKDVYGQVLSNTILSFTTA